MVRSTLGASTVYRYWLPAGLPRSGKLPVLNLLRPKIRFFALQGRLVAPIQVKLCRADGHVGLLGCAKFHLNRHRGVGMRPQKYQKFPLFGKESPRRGDSLDRFLIFLDAFIRLTMLH